MSRIAYTLVMVLRIVSLPIAVPFRFLVSSLLTSAIFCTVAVFCSGVVEAQTPSTPSGEFLAAPSDITLAGNIRRETISTALGRMELRWPRPVESLFGRTPERALLDAASASAKALRANGFPPKAQNLSLPWNVVFLDETLPEKEIPHTLISNCHPAWMTPPANLYVVAQRAAAGCGGEGRVPTSEADGRLAQILIHEIGHAVENVLLDGRMTPDRPRAEGFATWFEQFASRYSSVIPNGRVRQEHLAIARLLPAVGFEGQGFRGTQADYIAASLIFHVVEHRRGVRGIADLYERLAIAPQRSVVDVLVTDWRWSDQEIREAQGKVLSR